MAAKYEITAAEKIEIEQARAKNKDKKVEYKLKALSMRADGASAKKIGEATYYQPYAQHGLDPRPAGRADPVRPQAGGHGQKGGVRR